jgi:hypothetical protein
MPAADQIPAEHYMQAILASAERPQLAPLRAIAKHLVRQLHQG